MSKFNLIITADYEVFGNGSGDVRTCMVQPTKTLLNLCNESGAKLTLFTDVCELWAFQEVEASGQWDLDFSPSQIIIDQLKQAVQEGHDVQLHFHPQWLEYEYLGKGNWNLNHDKWRLPSLKAEEIEALFAKGKETLEGFLKPIDPSYTCDVFRAGGWCIQPEELVLNAMRKHKFKIESSVVPEVFNLQEERFFDFRHSPQLPYWNIENKVTQKGKGELVEIPIFSAKMSSMERARFLSLRAKRKVPFKPDGCSGFAESSKKQSKLSKAISLLKGGYTMFNFSDATTSDEMKWFIEKARSRFTDTNSTIPLVMIGHPKTFANEIELKEFLFWAAKQKDINFTDYHGYLNGIQ